MPRSSLYRIAPSVVAIVAGTVILVVAGNDFVPMMVGSVMLALGGIVFTALVFYEIGLSEDRERAASERPPPRQD